MSGIGDVLCDGGVGDSGEDGGSCGEVDGCTIGVGSARGDANSLSLPFE